MDNTKTGCLIKALRKEKGMTQKELADRLHVTDRAVSKWERGLCAPDLALLEPLAQTLGVSIVELLQGERTASGGGGASAEDAARSLLSYTQGELRRKLKAFRTRYAAAAAACLALLLLLGGFLLWRKGYFSVIDRCPSPDGGYTATVYGRDIFGSDPLPPEAVSLLVERPDGARTRLAYGDCVYQGLWWSPDSQKYVLSLRYGGQTRLALAWMEGGSEQNLSAILPFGEEEAEYQFLQWSADSTAMLLCYAYPEAGGPVRRGYFWYDCQTGRCSAPFALEGQR